MSTTGNIDNATNCASAGAVGAGPGVPPSAGSLAASATEGPAPISNIDSTTPAPPFGGSPEAAARFEQSWAAFSGGLNYTAVDKAIASFFYHLGRYDGVRETIR